MATIVQQTNGEKEIFKADEYTLVQQQLATMTNSIGTKAAQTDMTNVMSQLADIATNVKAKGADPTGINDSTSAIQNAINSLGSTGGTVLIPEGTYKITNTITIPAKVILKGQGKYSTIINYTGSNTAFALASGGVKYVGMEGIYVTNNGASQIGLDVVDCWFGKFRDLVFDGFNGEGVRLKNITSGFGVYWNLFEEVDTPNSQSAGIVFVQSGSDGVNLNTFIACRFNLGNTRKSIYGGYLQGDSNENIFIGCDFSYSTSYNIRLETGASRNLFIGCYSEQTTTGTSKGFSSDATSKNNKYYGGLIHNNNQNIDDASGTNEVDSHDGINPIKHIVGIVPIGNGIKQYQEGTTSDLSVTTSLGAVGTIPFPTPFPSGITPHVQANLSGLANSGQVTIVITSISNTGFTINAVSSVSNTITVDWTAIG